MAEHCRYIHRRRSHQRDRFSQKLRRNHVIAIERQYQLGLRGADADIACTRQPAVFLTDDPNGRIERCQFLPGCRIGRAIIDNDDFEIVEQLERERGKKLIDKAPAIEARHHDTDRRRKRRRGSRARLHRLDPVFGRSCPALIGAAAAFIARASRMLRTR